MCSRDRAIKGNPNGQVKAPRTQGGKPYKDKKSYHNKKREYAHDAPLLAVICSHNNPSYYGRVRVRVRANDNTNSIYSNTHMHVSYTHLRATETLLDIVCRLLL